MRNGRSTGVGLTFLITAACLVIAQPVHAESDQLVELERAYWDAKLFYDPLYATNLGLAVHTDRLKDFSHDAEREMNGKLGHLSGELRRLSPRTLNESGRHRKKLLLSAIQSDVLAIACDPRFAPLDPIYGAHLALPLSVANQPLEAVEDFEAYIKRLKAFPVQVDQMITNMRSGLSSGWSTPRVLVRKIPAQIDAHVVFESCSSDSVFYVGPAKRAENVLPANDCAKWISRLKETIDADVVPAYLRLRAFIEQEYLPKCREEIGLSASPFGERLYAARVRLHTTTGLTPDEIHKIGLKEVERIKGELAAIQKEIGFDGELTAFLEHMRTSKKYRAKSPEHMLSLCRQALERVKLQMSAYFGDLPETRIQVREMETYRAPDSPIGFYEIAPEYGGRPAYFILNTFGASQQPVYMLEALTYHEAIPGHHLQMALVQENDQLPDYQRYRRVSAFEEGWALYAEKLAEQMGGYEDSVQRFGRLNTEMWRACRLVVDTGIHAKNWSRPQAIDYLRNHVAFAEHEIAREVDRYIAWPGQALSYKIGELKLLELRDKAIAALGESFDLRAFHDEVLSDGAIPLDMLEDKIDLWIGRQKTKKP